MLQKRNSQAIFVCAGLCKDTLTTRGPAAILFRVGMHRIDGNINTSSDSSAAIV
jgi:hypothetical protein